MTGKRKRSLLGRGPSKRNYLRDSNGSPFPFISSVDERLVWKWHQIKLCGRMLNATVPCFHIPPACPANIPDGNGKFVKFSQGQVLVQRPAHLASLGADGYHLGIRAVGHTERPTIVLLGLHGPYGHSKLGKLSRRIGSCIANSFPIPFLESSLPSRYCWATEFWVSDSVVISRRTADDALVAAKASRAHAQDGPMMLHIGLPMTSFGPLINTLVSTWDAATARIELLSGFIWIDAVVDPSNVTIEGENSTEFVKIRLLEMLDQTQRGSWLVNARLMFKLDRLGRANPAILAELHEIFQIRVTSTHKPVTHS